MESTSSFKGARVLVTGATGFIGSGLCRRLLLEGASVYAACRQSSGEVASGVTRISATLEKSKSTHDLVREVLPDYVFHLAGVTSTARDALLLLPTFQTNLVTTVNLLAALVGGICRRVVLAGSFEERRSEADVVSSPYAASKWAASCYGRMCWDLFRVPFVDARIFMVYGPGQRDFKKLIPYTILSLMQGRAPRISSGARQVDWIYVDDVVNGLLALALAPGVEGQSIELGTGRVTAVKVVVDQLTRLINPDLPAVLGGVRDRVHEHVRCADLVRSTQLTGWRPSVALEDGLRRTIDYYLQTSSV